MTALDRAFIKAYAPTRQPSPAAAFSAAGPEALKPEAPAPEAGAFAGPSPEVPSPPAAMAAAPQIATAEQASAAPSAVPAPLPIDEPLPPDVLAPNEPPATTLAAIPAAPVAEPAQDKRLARAIGHAPSPLPAPHANFNGSARRTFKPSATAAAAETPVRNTYAPVIPTRSEKPPEAAIADPKVARKSKTKSRSENRPKRGGPAPMASEAPQNVPVPVGFWTGSLAAKAAPEQPPAPTRAKRQPVKAEPPQPEAAKPVVRGRKPSEAAQATSPAVSVPTAAAPAARPKRKTTKPKLKTAQRDERIDAIEPAVEISSSEVPQQGEIAVPAGTGQGAPAQPAIIAESAPAIDTASMDAASIDAASIDAASIDAVTTESAVARVESPSAPELPASEAPAALPHELSPSSQAETAQTGLEQTDGPRASSVEANQTDADPVVLASAPAAAAGAQVGARTERRPLSDFVKQLPVEDAFHPHLEVDYFLWPSAVNALVERGGPALGNFATQLTTQAGTGEKVLALSGGGRGEGRTSVILAVARQIAQRGGRVVIVDADFEKPDLARYVGLAPEFGWDDVLQGELPLEEVLITSLRDRVAIVPWQRRLSPGVLPFHPLRASISLGMLRDHYDLVLVDGGPLLSDGKPNGLASLVQAAQFDGSYLVSDCRPQAACTLAEPLRMARNVGLRIFGAIENFSSLAPEASAPLRAAA